MLPNILTTFRLVIIPFFAYSILTKQSIWLSLSLFLLSGLTDIVDGWIARHFNMITDVGSVYDPLVDKLMQITAAVCLSLVGVIPVWVICVVLIKEFAMIAAGIVLYIKKIVVHSNWYGKAATVFFYAVMLVLIVFRDIGEMFKNIMLITLAAVLVMAAVGYLFKLVGNNKNEICKNKV